MMSQPPI